MNKLLLVIAAIACVLGQNIPNEDWGYVNVNEQYDSNMFWWFYGARSNRNTAPLVLFLQGGPGASSLFGDYLEMGPNDVYGNARNTSWVDVANMLFVDNPVGTGFSYTNNILGYSTTDKQIADNLVLLLAGFLQKYPIFNSRPVWIFSESYGGKMTANFGVALDIAIQQKQIGLKDFRGVALGDSWIAPVDCMYSYPPFLLSISLINQEQANNLTVYAEWADNDMAEGLGVNATNWWGIQQDIAEDFADNVNIYNYNYYYDYLPENKLAELAQTVLHKKWNIPENVSWSGENDQVFESMEGDFMKPGVAAVEYLLEKGYVVAVYSGQLDIIVDVICIESWMSTLNWNGLNAWLNAPRVAQLIEGTPQGYSQIYENLQMWGVFKAGHMVPADNPEMALKMISSIISTPKK